MATEIRVPALGEVGGGAGARVPSDADALTGGEVAAPSFRQPAAAATAAAAITTKTTAPFCIVRS